MAITLTPSVASPEAAKDAVRIDVAGGSSNDTADYDTNAYPTEAELRVYLAFLKGGEELGRSYVFTVDADGNHSFDNYIFPSAGSWSIELRRADDDSALQTQAITVS